MLRHTVVTDVASGEVEPLEHTMPRPAQHAAPGEGEGEGWVGLGLGLG